MAKSLGRSQGISTPISFAEVFGLDEESGYDKRSIKRGLQQVLYHTNNVTLDKLLFFSHSL